MKTILFIFTTFLSFGQEDTLGHKVIEANGPVHYDEVVIDMCDTYIPANFMEGTTAMLEYISNHLIYPECATITFSAKVYVSFTVELDGELTNIQVYRAPCPEMETIIIDLFDKMPLWSPASDAYHGGLRSHMRIPIQICYR